MVKLATYYTKIYLLNPYVRFQTSLKTYLSTGTLVQVEHSPLTSHHLLS